MHQAGNADMTHKRPHGLGADALDATQCTRQALPIREITGVAGMLCAALQGTAGFVAVLPCRAETQPPRPFTRGDEAVAHNCRFR
ncbi:conserved protein of unknown function [Cupriavidus taiwanensis]|uniref:Uncharacterized protein n=1 Tax=Cupriavidus taiwanensis TaxID=164546 RepID=A0A375IJE7_9BURK|nr:conserved protein of unknown function [Cupriavidus taiwanensis]